MTFTGSDLVPFREKAPWWGGDMQTLRNRLASRMSPLPSRSSEIMFTMSDGSGDRLIAKLEEPAEPVINTPLVLLIHGLTGCQDSTYVRETARFHLVRGRTVVRLNLRGAGPGRHVARGYYHAGCTQDVSDVLDDLAASHACRGVFAIGFSLGGNILINLLANLPPGQHIVGAATVSAPIDPSEACCRLMQPRNYFYHRWLLHRMKQDILSGSQLPSAEVCAIEEARSIYELDDKWVAPRNGFQGADDYYEKTAGAHRIPKIAIPTLILHAANDPWIPATPYRRLLDGQSGPFEVRLTKGGGHVGFHEFGYGDTWHDRTIDRFLDRVIARRSTSVPSPRPAAAPEA